MERRSIVASLAGAMVVSLTVALAGTASAHLGDIVYPIWEIPTSDLPNLHDGTLEDWEAVLPHASLDHNDFAFVGNLVSEVDLEDLAFRVFLAWHGASQRIYMGIERIDDVYQTSGNGSTTLMIDGDHSGGQELSWEESSGYSQEEIKRLWNSQAQSYHAWPEATGDRRMLQVVPWLTWTTEPAWGDVGGYQYGESPNISVVELTITAWDDLDWNGPELSKRSLLEAGRIVGFNIAVMDYDEPDSPEGGRAPDGVYLLAKLGDFGDFLSQSASADNFADGELIPCFRGDCSGATTAVSQDSWGRIKTSFR